MRTASMTGCQLRVGDVVWEWGLRWAIQSAPVAEILDNGVRRWYVPVQCLDLGQLPPQFMAAAIVHGHDYLWTVEFPSR